MRADEVDGGFFATAITTQGETLEELRTMVRDAVRCHFGDGAPGPMPQIIRLHFVRVLGYERVRQDGSHIRLTTTVGGTHHARGAVPQREQTQRASAFCSAALLRRFGMTSGK